MATPWVILCPCQDLPAEPSVLARRLERAGAAVRVSPPLCTPAGLAELEALGEPAEGVLLAACGPLSRQVLPVCQPFPVVDLLSAADLEEAVGRVLAALARPLPPPAPLRLRSREVLVVGGGIAGVQAALDLAEAGILVHLFDAALSIGGTMARLDKTFPTLDCSICILGPRLVEAASHPRINLITWGELEQISGRAGDFQVEITEKPRYVDMSRCVGCGACSRVCPVILPSRWNLGLSPRKCIRIVFAQAVPLRATLEREYCIDCRLCESACERQAIDLAARPRTRILHVAAIVVATGAVPLSPRLKGEYHYGDHRRVLTGLEFERLVCATGPTGGALVGPDGRPLKSLAFIQCAGSRDRRFLPYCSGICCAASLKQALIAKEHDPEVEITVFFNDLRLAGKGGEDLLHRAREAGIRLVQGLPGAIEPDPDGGVRIISAALAGGGPRRLRVDLAVLAVGLAPPPPHPVLEDLIGPRDVSGFYQAADPVLAPLDACTPGVFFAGTCLGPKDITESVSQGSAAAARVLTFLRSAF
ncbi:MAG: CoB--CoM heterodisulfide reductase iron-sulfur subunit A family protein [Desulfobaccales bacterium]